MILWEAWFALVEDSPQLAPDRRRELLSRGSEFFFRYADLLSDYVAEAYQREARRLRGNGEQRRIQRDQGAPRRRSARRLLARLRPRAPSPRPHRLGRGPRRPPPASSPPSLGRPLLFVSPLERTQPAGPGSAGTRPLDARRGAPPARASSPPAARLALGLEAFGEAGFRATHRQALRARRFAGERRAAAAPLRGRRRRGARLRERGRRPRLRRPRAARHRGRLARLAADPRDARRLLRLRIQRRLRRRRPSASTSRPSPTASAPPRSASASTRSASAGSSSRWRCACAPASPPSHPRRIGAVIRRPYESPPPLSANLRSGHAPLRQTSAP